VTYALEGRSPIPAFSTIDLTIPSGKIKTSVMTQQGLTDGFCHSFDRVCYKRGKTKASGVVMFLEVV
jgi:hypothetical protein